MSISGVIKTYGYPNLRFGHVIANIDIRSHDEARLLEELIHKAMREMAGDERERTLARWSNSIATTRRNAEAQKWIGWSDEQETKP